MSFWRGKNVLVAGRGFLGSETATALMSLGASVASVSRSSSTSGDFFSLDNAIHHCLGKDVVINLAGSASGIASSQHDHPKSFYENASIGFNLLEAARRTGVSTYVLVSSACVYPATAKAPIRECTAAIDSVHPDAFGYGMSKLVQEIHATVATGATDVKIARAFNAYGPKDASRHVLPDLFRKITRDPHRIELWGGQQRRSLTYITDWVEGLLTIAEHGKHADPVNLGSPSSVSIRDLALLAAKHLAGTEPEIVSTIGPTGHSDRTPDTAKIEAMGWSPKVSLDVGVLRAASWWKESSIAC